MNFLEQPGHGVAGTFTSCHSKSHGIASKISVSPRSVIRVPWRRSVLNFLSPKKAAARVCVAEGHQSAHRLCSDPLQVGTLESNIACFQQVCIWRSHDTFDYPTSNLRMLTADFKRCLSPSF